jgi:acyl-CoA thioester hydrolase
LRALGVDQVAMMEQERRIFVVTKTKAEFVAPARFNDQIVVTARLAGLTRATFEIEQNIYLGSLDGTLVLRGSVRAACLNADTLRPTRVAASIFEETTS